MKTNQSDSRIRQIQLFLLAGPLFMAACSSDPDPTVPIVPDPDPSTVASCEGCHTDYETLKQIADPDTGSGGGGCGGDIPHIEPYDRVYMGGDGYQQFRASSHGQERCTTCHGGIDSTADKYLAHSGDFTASPSSSAEDHCAPCHADVTERHSSSLHAGGWGQKSMVTVRYGATGFDALPEALRSGYNANCAKCHATCGDCHVNRPHAGGGGLYRGHQFLRSPDMRGQCAACHSSRIAHAFFGVGSGTIPDVHMQSGFECLTCHSSAELHGDGQQYVQRYSMALIPECTDCHNNARNANAYHTMHWDTFNCQTCHSQDYNNCGSCHVGGEGARIPAYLGFKIGMNPLPDTKSYTYATLRRSLMAPDSWQNYGVSLLPSFDARPTFKYTTPHNIRRWTRRTTVDPGASCFDKCHIINENGIFRNRELFLFNSDLQDWEINADRDIVVDGKLPPGWEGPH